MSNNFIFFLRFNVCFIERGFERFLDYFDIFLVNNSENTIPFQYSCFNKKRPIENRVGNINPASDIFLHKLNFDFITSNLNFMLEWKKDNTYGSFINHFVFKPKAEFIVTQVDKLLKENLHSFDVQISPTSIIKKENEYIYDKIKINKKTGTANSNVKYHLDDIKLASSQYVVDIHIEKLGISIHNLTNTDIIELQLAEVDKFINLALKSNLKSIIIVHGIGKGVLKKAVHELLKTYTFVSTFRNEYHHLYGFGSTEVYF